MIQLKEYSGKKCLYEAHLRRESDGEEVWIITADNNFRPKKGFYSGNGFDSLIPVQKGDHVMAAKFVEGELKIKIYKIAEISGCSADLKKIGNQWNVPLGAAEMVEALKDKIYGNIKNIYVKL